MASDFAAVVVVVVIIVIVVGSEEGFVVTSVNETRRGIRIFFGTIVNCGQTTNTATSVVIVAVLAVMAASAGTIVEAAAAADTAAVIGRALPGANRNEGRNPAAAVMTAAAISRVFI